MVGVQRGRGTVKVVLDASALISILTGEPGADSVTSVAIDSVISAVNLAEARDHLARSIRSTARAAAAIEVVLGLGLRVAPGDRTAAEAAADLRSERYHRAQSAISLADCFAIELALRDERVLVSSDGLQLRAAADAGVRVHPIANSVGVVPDV